jgi:hypothetical protein
MTMPEKTMPEKTQTMTKNSRAARAHACTTLRFLAGRGNVRQALVLWLTAQPVEPLPPLPLESLLHDLQTTAETDPRCSNLDSQLLVRSALRALWHLAADVEEHTPGLTRLAALAWLRFAAIAQTDEAETYCASLRAGLAFAIDEGAL